MRAVKVVAPAGTWTVYNCWASSTMVGRSACTLDSGPPWPDTVTGP